MEETMSVEKTLLEFGYARFSARDLVTLGGLVAEFEKLRESCRLLPADPYCAAGNRFRRYSRCYLYPVESWIGWHPAEFDRERGWMATPFVQDAALNPDEGGRVRMLASLTASQRANSFLRELILAYFAMIPVEDRRGADLWMVGIHLIQQVARANVPARITPDRFHRDGEPYTYVTLIDRQNAAGGETYVAPVAFANEKLEALPPGEIKACFALLEPLESYVVRDIAVAHYVDPVHLAGDAELGWRTVVLIDFTPEFPRFAS
jgi:hypothetical protein